MNVERQEEQVVLVQLEQKSIFVEHNEHELVLVLR